MTISHLTRLIVTGAVAGVTVLGVGGPASAGTVTEQTGPAGFVKRQNVLAYTATARVPTWTCSAGEDSRFVLTVQEHGFYHSNGILIEGGCDAGEPTAVDASYHVGSNNGQKPAIARPVVPGDSLTVTWTTVPGSQGGDFFDGTLSVSSSRGWTQSYPGAGTFPSRSMNDFQADITTDYTVPALTRFAGARFTGVTVNRTHLRDNAILRGIQRTEEGTVQADAALTGCDSFTVTWRAHE